MVGKQEVLEDAEQLIFDESRLLPHELEVPALPGYFRDLRNQYSGGNDFHRRVALAYAFSARYGSDPSILAAAIQEGAGLPKRADAARIFVEVMTLDTKGERRTVLQRYSLHARAVRNLAKRGVSPLEAERSLRAGGIQAWANTDSSIKSGLASPRTIGAARLASLRGGVSFMFTLHVGTSWLQTWAIGSDREAKKLRDRLDALQQRFPGDALTRSATRLSADDLLNAIEQWQDSEASGPGEKKKKKKSKTKP